MHDNPFVYGEIAPRFAFVDRQDELDRLVRDLGDGQKVFLISPRRYGKSSLIGQAMRSLSRRGALAVELTVSSYSSYLSFLEGYTRAVLRAETGWERGVRWLRDAIGAARPDVRVDLDAAGTPGMTVAFPTVRTEREISRLANDVFSLPGRLSEERRRLVVVALDEFQAIGGFDGGTVEHALRAAVQQQRRAGYVFAGSEPSLMERMLGPRRPFYKAGPVMRLGKIPPDLFAEFIETRMRETGLRPDAGVGQAIVELAGNLPYDVQRLAHETWDDVRAARRRQVGLDDLHAVLRRLLSEQHVIFETVWQRLTLAQRAVLRTVVVEEGREMLSEEVRRRHRLGGASTVQTALSALSREDIVMREGGRYLVVDSLMREWIARRTF
jgi:hypothetical protein